MAANTVPVFVATPNIGFSTADGDGGSAGPIKTANTAKDGTGTSNLVWTAGANGGWLEGIEVRAVGTNTASVVRVFLNNAGAQGTGTNNTLIAEATLPATTLSEVASLTPVHVPINRMIPATYRIYVVIGTSVAAGVQVTAFGGNY